MCMLSVVVFLKSIMWMKCIIVLHLKVRELEAKLRARNDEFEKFQKEVVIPQSKLQGDLNIAQLEKV